MAIETEVKFRMNRTTWQAIKAEYAANYPVHTVEQQTNKYYNTKDNQVEKLRVGLRLRVLPQEDRSIVAIKRDTKVAHKREEIQEEYAGVWEQLPPHSPALQAFLQEISSSYEDIVPLVTLVAERTIYLLEEPELRAEVCFDDVTILGDEQEHKLYEIEFELLDGSEQRLLAITDQFRRAHGDKVEQSAISKLEYALQTVGKP